MATSHTLNIARSHERACLAATQRHIGGCSVCRSRGVRWVGSLPSCEIRHACEAEQMLAKRRRIYVEFYSSVPVAPAAHAACANSGEI